MQGSVVPMAAAMRIVMSMRKRRLRHAPHSRLPQKLRDRERGEACGGRRQLVVASAPGAAPRAYSSRRFADPRRDRRVALSDVAQLLRLGEALQLLQRLVLDLADPLARDVERPPDLVERARVLPAQAVAQLEHAPLAVGEVLQRLAQRLLGEDLRGALVRRRGPLVGDELAELGLLLVADRLLERDR